MAQYNEILVGRYNRLLQKLLSMKGGPPAASLAGDIMATIPLFHGVENRYLEGWDRFGFAFQVAALGVGITGGHRLRNPVGSNVLIVVEQFWYNNQSGALQTAQLEIGNFTTGLGAESAATAFVDNRGRPGSTGRISSGDATGSVGGAVVRVTMAANSVQPFILTTNQEFQILPGSGIQLRSPSTNTIIDGCWLWRERFLEDSERA